MAIIQNSDIRWIKRKNLEEESRVIAGWYKDCIRQYGIDCVYHKLDMSDFQNFKTTIDSNTILKRAYGCEINPDYNVSASMVAFAEVDSDIFALNKYGIVPQTEINLYFDSKQFACDLAPKVGQYREYKIENTEIFCDVPAFTSGEVSAVDPDTGKTVSEQISSRTWPYTLNLGSKNIYKCDILSGQFRCQIDGYDLEKVKTVMCDPYEHTDFNISFKQNDDLAYSLKYKIENDDYLETLLFLTYKVNRVIDENCNERYVLSGMLHGSVLFFDINELGKYAELIHPMIGDIVEIDFPDENNREKYEITDCFDKQLTQDGINPLLHKYIWKCKAKRYVHGSEPDNALLNDEDRKLIEKINYDNAVQDIVSEKVSDYEVLDEKNNISEDAVYGGYDGVALKYDEQFIDPDKHQKYEYRGESAVINIIKFEIGSSLVTDGYDLIFIPKNSHDWYIVAKNDRTPNTDDLYFESNIRWLKATNDKIVFVNVEGESITLAEDEIATDNQVILCLNDLNSKTLDTVNINSDNNNFIKFKGTRSYMWSDGHHLYAKLCSNDKLYRLI